MPTGIQIQWRLHRGQSWSKEASPWAGGRQVWILSAPHRAWAWQPPNGSASLPAIFYTAAILGPAAGYLIGGTLLNIYTEIGQR